MSQSNPAPPADEIFHIRMSDGRTIYFLPVDIQEQDPFPEIHFWRSSEPISGQWVYARVIKFGDDEFVQIGPLPTEVPYEEMQQMLVKPHTDD